MLTIEQVKAFYYGQIILAAKHNNANGTPQRWKVVSQVKTWKRDPNRVQVSLKRGLYEHFKLTEKDLHLFTIG